MRTGFACLLIVVAAAGCERQTPKPTEVAVPEARSSAESAPSAPPAESSAPAPVVSASENDCEHFPGPPPGAEKLCDQHDLATNAEVSWQSYATREDRVTVNRPYQEWASRCHMGLVFKPPIFSVTQGPTRLSTHEVNDGGFPTCDKKPSPEHKTVIVISTKLDR